MLDGMQDLKDMMQGLNKQNQEQNLLYMYPGTELLNVKVMRLCGGAKGCGFC